MTPSELDSIFLSDKNLERTFLTSALLGIGSLAVPFLAPVALTGMITSQSVYWGRKLLQEKN